MHLGAPLRHIKMQNDPELVRSVKWDLPKNDKNPIKPLHHLLLEKHPVSNLPAGYHLLLLFQQLQVEIEKKLLFSSVLADTAKFLPEQLTLANVSYSLGQIHSHTFSVYCSKMYPQRNVLLFFLTQQILFLFAWYTVNTIY